MAWIRTAAALIGFGFALYKYFFFLREDVREAHPEQFLGPRTFGLIMIGIGVFTLAVAAWQHHRQLKHLRAEYGASPPSLSLVVAGLIAILGILGFIAAALHQ
jgi:putative membrane protein